jgi:hypothetical protein
VYASSATFKKNGGHPLRTTEERYQYIESMKAEHAIAQLCATLGVTDSGPAEKRVAGGVVFGRFDGVHLLENQVQR